MAVRTKLLAAGRLSTTTTVTVYTTPADETAIVKRLHIANVSATDTRTITAGADVPGFDKTFYWEDTLMPRKSVDVETWLVLPPGYEFTLRSDGTTSVNYWISGTELEGVAD